MTNVIEEAKKKIDYDEIRKRCIRARKYVDKSQEDIAIAIGEPLHNIKAIEAGRTKIDITRIVAWAMATGESLHYLMCLTNKRIDEPKPEELNFRTRSSGALRIENDLMCLIK